MTDDRNDQKTEDIVANEESVDTTAESPSAKTDEAVEETPATEEAPSPEETPVGEENPVEEVTPATETPAEDVAEQTESADEEETSPEKVEEQIDNAQEESENTTDASNETVNEEKPDETSENQEDATEESSDEKDVADTEAEDLSTEDKDEKPETPTVKKDPNIPDDAKWYIVHTYAGHENKVARNLKQRVESMGFETRIFDIIVPTRETIKVSQGRKETVQEKIFPGYVIIRMVLDDESWLLVRTTQGVTAFIGAGNKPTPISEQEVEAIQKFMQMDEPLYKASFSVGEAVKIVDGPFADFLGTIDDIDEARGKIKVLVSIFGRETPVELDFLQAQKL